MNILEHIGNSIAVIVITIVSYRLYRNIFGHSWDSCPNDHDTMARHGVSKCDKCGNKL